MKTVQLTLSDEVLEQIEQAAQEQGRTPEEIIQLAIDHALKAHRRKMLEPELERRDEEGYRRCPVRPGEFAISSDNLWPSDPVEDAFWEEFYQEWLKQQEGENDGTLP